MKFVATQHISRAAQVVWPIVGQEILNGDVGGFQGIQITWFFQLWRASGITSELQLTQAIGGLVMAAAMFFAAGSTTTKCTKT
jgi:photosystem I P700 chlorophyll a apoprotein A1